MLRAKIVLLLALFATALHGEDPDVPARARFYDQKEWGTPAFLLLRTGDAGLTLKIAQTGAYTFDEDAIADDFSEVRAEWSQFGGAVVVPLIVDQQGSRWKGTHSAAEGANRWNVKDFALEEQGQGVAEAAPIKIISVGWRVKASEPGELLMKNCQMLSDDGKIRPLFDENEPSPAALLLETTSQAKQGATPDDGRPRVFIAGDTVALCRPDWIKAWTEWGAKEFPGQFGIDMGSSIFPDIAAALKPYRDAGVVTLFESHQARLPGWSWARNQKFYGTRFDGFTPNDPFWPKSSMNDGKETAWNGVDKTQEGAYELTLQRMEALFDMGFNSYTLIDYTWPYFGGRWGYGPAAIEQWKKHLKGEGGKMDLCDPVETWAFADYWKRFTSIPLTPDEFGWKTWDDFQCGTEAAAQDAVGARKLLLFNALWHFQSLVYLDRLGREAEARGRELAISVNPEDISNGVDMTLLARLKHLQSLGIEYFGSPLSLNALEHTVNHLRHRTGGPRIDLIGEINAGGHGPTRYDREVAYAFYYEVTDTTLPRDYNVQYLEGFWLAPASLNAMQTARFDHWWAGANSFLLRHREETPPVTPRPTVTVVASRSILEYQDSSSHSLGQERNLASYLAALNVDFEQVGRDAMYLPLDNHTRTLFFCPAMATPAELAEVRQWIESGEGRTLVLHGGSGWRSDSQPDRPEVAAVQWQPNRSYREKIKLQPPVIDSSLLALAGMKENATWHFSGQAMTGALWSVKEDDQELVLASDENIPLVTTWKTGTNGVNRIYLIAPDLPLASAAGLSIVGKIVEKAGLQTFAAPLDDWQLRSHPVPGGSALVAWNIGKLTEQDRTNFYQRVAAPASATVRGEPSTEYDIESVFDNKIWKQTSNAQGELVLKVAHSPDILYFGKESPAFHKSMAEAAKAYDAVRNKTRDAK